jgi:hypothetical protein
MTEPGAVWTSLRRPPIGLSARLHPESSDVWLALDSEGRRHLLVRAPDAELGQTLAETRGLRATTETLAIEGQDQDIWTDIVCLDPALNDTFVAVADNLAEEARLHPGDPVEAVRRTLRTWQWFWGVDPNALSVDSALGLFGELWFLDRWAPFPEAIDTWLGPTGHRHDFVSRETSVEVKATRTRTDGTAVHRIANLDQLAEPEAGDLYLFSLQAVHDPNAMNTLPGLITRIRNRLGSQADRLGVLDQRLGQAGWSPANADRHAQAYRIVAEELYRVGDGFPRLVRETFAAGIPIGVDGIRYTLDLAACAPWRIATLPPQAEEILAGLR